MYITFKYFVQRFYLYTKLFIQASGSKYFVVVLVGAPHSVVEGVRPPAYSYYYCCCCRCLCLCRCCCFCYFYCSDHPNTICCCFIKSDCRHCGWSLPRGSLALPLLLLLMLLLLLCPLFFGSLRRRAVAGGRGAFIVRRCVCVCLWSACVAGLRHVYVCVSEWLCLCVFCAGCELLANLLVVVAVVVLVLSLIHMCLMSVFACS